MSEEAIHGRRRPSFLAGCWKCLPASFSVDRLSATYPKGTLRSPSPLRPCWNDIFSILLCHRSSTVPNGFSAACYAHKSPQTIDGSDCEINDAHTNCRIETRRDIRRVRLVEWTARRGEVCLVYSLGLSGLPGWWIG